MADFSETIGVDSPATKLVILDRDGVINYHYGYVHKFKNFKFRRGVIKGLKYLIKKISFSLYRF